ncbi:MAG TPA: haloacid dehalogenase type II [Steroidobacteraceae bacterium]|nr:haloacid dehalogenase type II [Steroidobacteraceae bacterium]
MDLDRRTFLTTATAALAAPALMAASDRPAIRALLFDAFPIFDPRSIATACERMFPGQGAALIGAWRTRQFDYQWHRALGGRYADFWRCTADALDTACEALSLDASAAQRDELMQAWLQLDVWPDVPAAVRELCDRGLTLAFLSNATHDILKGGLKRAGLEPFFPHVISTDRARTFKPAPHAYRLGTELLGLDREEILFVAFAGWDVAGAKWFGYPVFWNNRTNAPAERLEAVPDGRGTTLGDLLRFLGNVPPRE